MKEFYTGLELLGFGLILKNSSKLLKPIFVGQVEEVDANSLVASIKATFSELGTNRRNIEEYWLFTRYDYKPRKWRCSWGNRETC